MVSKSHPAMFMFTSGINRRCLVPGTSRPGLWPPGTRWASAADCKRDILSYKPSLVVSHRTTSVSSSHRTPHRIACSRTTQEKRVASTSQQPAVGSNPQPSHSSSWRRGSLGLCLITGGISSGPQSPERAKARARGRDLRAGQTGTDTRVQMNMRFAGPLRGHDNV